MAFLSNRFYKKGKNRTNEHRASEAALNDFWNLETFPLWFSGCLCQQIDESFFQSRIGKYLFAAMPPA